MDKEIDFTTAKQATISKWKKVEELLREASALANTRCEFCILAGQNRHMCGDCPADDVCGGANHCAVLLDLPGMILSATKLCDEIVGIEEVVNEAS